MKVCRTAADNAFRLQVEVAEEEPANEEPAKEEPAEEGLKANHGHPMGLKDPMEIGIRRASGQTRSRSRRATSIEESLGVASFGIAGLGMLILGVVYLRMSGILLRIWSERRTS